ncbi:amidohydrolase family protein [Roseiconus lacunae]|uniref:Amidohydrolase family protein n=1 Tax=Roseiconus lacunae TaxID=2605694 RepID=A0ABT7PQG1_9BACT|nr:amidohydrolase family protein [Roseiconus lacunae]MCD0463434.1 amidohydrolase family protein [Roseiconus lacunae]MDM4018748.1 amidohydrolase family protein [Roseiconus lacunae]WRQ48557.1 amidohydrolase family protein [Stieleria sp. HD01]
MNHFAKLCFAVVLLAASDFVVAHDQIPGAPQRQPIALVGGTIHTVDGKMIADGTLVFDEGKITAIGKGVDLPKRCRTIDVAGQHVYPGLMESLSNLGLTEIGSTDSTIDTDEVGDENGNLQPHVAVNPDSELIPVARSGGVLLASIAPRRGDIRGQSSVIQLDGWSNHDMLVAANTGLVVYWRAFDSRAGDDGDRAKQRDTNLTRFADRLDEARRYGEAIAADDTVPTDLRLQALLSVVNGDSPMIIVADHRREIEAGVAFCIGEGIRPVIYGGYDAPQCATLLKKHDVPVIVRTTYRLPTRRDDPYDHPYTLPKRLHDLGVTFAIGGPGSGSPGGASAARNLPYHAAVAAAYGLPPEIAIRAITLSPCEIMGIDDRLGSLTIDKDATLIVSDGDILLTESNVTHAFIKGAEVDLGSKHKTLAAKYRTKYRQQNKSK